jgi:hypothetical protein
VEVGVRFEVSRMMDTIEQRLTTDIVLAQVVVDLGEICRYTELDGGRPVNLMRIGMVVDAIGRYLRDGGSMIYPVAPRSLLSEPELTAKERMVLGRWTDDGLIEATPDPAGRVPEIAELTGLPMVTIRDFDAMVDQFRWLADAPLRVLTMSPRLGGALITDGAGGTGGVVLTRPGGKPAAKPAASTPPKEKVVGTATAASSEEPDESALRRIAAEMVRIWPNPDEPVYEPLPEPPSYLPAPSPAGAALTTRKWQCDGYDCPSFGPDRRLGQPVPMLRAGRPRCPRHDEPLRDVGPRPLAVPMTLIVDGLRRRHFVVTAGQPVLVGRGPEEPDAIAVNEWLHQAAASWISRTHLKLEVIEDRLMVTDVSTNGTLLWVRKEPGDRPDTYRLGRNKSFPLGEWDTAELYTGIELCRADRRPKGVDESHDEPSSVLTDAPTVALRRLGA